MGALVFKIIKPQRLKVDAMRLALLNPMRKVGTGIKADFEKTVSTWKNKPKFDMQISLSPVPQTEVSTVDKIYGYVDQGTKGPYEIWAGYYTGKSNKKNLAFSSKSTPKTTPGVIGSSGGSRGTVDTFRPYVEHPGIKARNFSKEIEKIWQPKFKRAMEGAMSKVAKASGHAL